MSVGNRRNFSSTYEGRRVLVTGNTGFKGAWLTAWLYKLGADVFGISNEIPTNPSLFEVASLERKIKHTYLDIRDRESLRKKVKDIQPDFVFHLAAQALVKRSYEDPCLTVETNVLGTLNVLESLRSLEKRCSAVIITSDKAYDNVEWVWGYRETDPLGGKDPYSASKGAAELIVRSYVASFLNDSLVKMAVGRAGNVIGGGDWAADRIVPDAIRAWSANKSLEIRSPNATRPWQHVLEPLSAYLHLGARLHADSKLHGEPFNFGPTADSSFSVSHLLNSMKVYWPAATWVDTSTNRDHQHEAILLKLNCDKALHCLGWKSNLDFVQTVKYTMDWYRNYYDKILDNWEFTSSQIDSYSSFAAENRLIWTV